MLTRKFTLPISGEYPKDLVLLPDDKHLVLANHASNTLTTFTVDYEDVYKRQILHRITASQFRHKIRKTSSWKEISLQ